MTLAGCQRYNRHAWFGHLDKVVSLQNPGRFIMLETTHRGLQTSSLLQSESWIAIRTRENFMLFVCRILEWFYTLIKILGGRCTGLPRWPSGKHHPANRADSRDVGWISGSERSPGVGNGNPLQYFCLGNPLDRGALWATVHGVTNSQTQLSTWACTHEAGHLLLLSWLSWPDLL